MNIQRANYSRLWNFHTVIKQLNKLYRYSFLFFPKYNDHLFQSIEIKINIYLCLTFITINTCDLLCLEIQFHQVFYFLRFVQDLQLHIPVLSFASSKKVAENLKFTDKEQLNFLKKNFNQ